MVMWISRGYAVAAACLAAAVATTTAFNLQGTQELCFSDPNHHHLCCVMVAFSALFFSHDILCDEICLLANSVFCDSIELFFRITDFSTESWLHHLSHLRSRCDHFCSQWRAKRWTGAVLSQKPAWHDYPLHASVIRRTCIVPLPILTPRCTR